MTQRAFAGLLAAAFILGGAAGCSRKEPVPAPVVKKMAPRPDAAGVPGKAPEAEEKKPAPVTVYNPAGKRDPFIPFIKTETKQSQPKVDLSSLPPLQRYELSELKFVGVIWEKKGGRALVEDAEGKGYSVMVGSRIGRMGGVVTRITEKEIFVKEEFTGVRGDKVSRENVLQLISAGGK